VLAVDPRQALGKRGEDLACEELERRGYDILDRRFRTRFGELDIVARDNGVLVFVEVRARGSGRFGNPAESVTAQKQRRVAAMAESYLGLEAAGDRVCRFDVVAVESETEPPRVTVYPDAFRPGW
jgi:putative endonuclease